MTDNLYDDICECCGGTGQSPHHGDGECPVCNGYGRDMADQDDERGNE